MRSIHNFIPASANVSLDVLSLPNCMYLSEQARCRILNVKKCSGGECSFCTTHEHAELSMNRWAARLSAQKNARQLQLAKKYYSGAMPWRERTVCGK